MTVFPAARPSVSIKAGAKYPAGVMDGTGVATLLQNGVIRSNLKFDGLMPAADFERGEKFTAVFNALTGQYEKVELTSELAAPLVAEKYGVIPITHPDYAANGGFDGNDARWQALLLKATTTGQRIELGAGVFHFRRFTVQPNVSCRGQGLDRTKVVFSGGHSEDLMVFPLPVWAQDNLLVPPCEWSDMSIDFNGADQTSGRGIFVPSPDAGGPVGHYGTAPVFRRMRMWGAKGDAVVYQFGRNMVRMYECFVRNGQANGVVIAGSMDSKIDRCYLSEHYSGINLYFYAGSGLQVTNTHIFSGRNNLVKDPQAYDLRMSFCDYDRAQEDAVVLYGNATGASHHVYLEGGTYVYSSQQNWRDATPPAFSDIVVRGAIDLVVAMPHIPYYGGAHANSTVHFIRFETWNGYTPLPARIIGAQYAIATAASLWTGGFTNDWTKIHGLINRDFGFRHATDARLNFHVGGTVTWTHDASFSQTYKSLYLQNAALIVDATAAAAGERKTAFGLSNKNGRHWAGLVLRSDDDTSASLGFGQTRIGTTFHSVVSPPLPDWHAVGTDEWHLEPVTGALRQKGASWTLPRVAEWIGDSSSGAGSVSNYGAPAFTAVGSVNAIGSDTVNAARRLRRADYRASAAVNACGGYYLTGSGGWKIGDASLAEHGGFVYRQTVGVAIDATNATHRAFIGMSAATAAPTDVTLSTLVNVLGVGWDSGDANVSVVYNDAAGAPTKIDLGASFPRPTASWASMWAIEFYAVAGTSQRVKYCIKNLMNDAVATGEITSDLPATNVYLTPRGWMGSGGTSAAVGLSFAHLKIDSKW